MFINLASLVCVGWSWTRSYSTEENARAHGSTWHCKSFLINLHLYAFVVAYCEPNQKQGKQGSQQNPDQERAQEDAKRSVVFLAENVLGFELTPVLWLELICLGKLMNVDKWCLVKSCLPKPEREVSPHLK